MVIEKGVPVLHSNIADVTKFRIQEPFDTSGYYFYITTFNFEKLYILPTECIKVSCSDNTQNGDYVLICTKRLVL
jgi:hypothetical protein